MKNFTTLMNRARDLSIDIATYIAEEDDRYELQQLTDKLDDIIRQLTAAWGDRESE